MTFEEYDGRLVLVYESEREPATWLDNKLKNHRYHTFFNTFTVTERIKTDVETDNQYYDEDNLRYFTIGRSEGEYWRIDKHVLDIKYDLLISKSLTLQKKTFVAHRDISIFRKIDGLVEQQIIVGGDHPDAIPENEFDRLQKEFPTSTELWRYADSRMAHILNEYFETMTDAEKKLANFFNRRESRLSEVDQKPKVATKIANKLDLEKYSYIRDQLESMLADQEAYTEAEWQEAVADIFLLIYPQYIAVLHKVSISERYSHPGKSTKREFDLVLVNANGCVDLIEIKRPSNTGVLSQGRYRDNHYFLRELSGTIMQSEKYIFYLNKGGISAEKEITEKYISELPKDMGIKVSNPKSIILCGRDNEFSVTQKDDFEFIKRKYSHVIDIITYDDLLRRLDNLVAMLKRR